MRKVAVVGGGPAGMMAAIAAAEAGNDVFLFEKNEKLGKKLFLTGKGRCNLTNAMDIADFFGEVERNPKFLYSAFYGFDNRAVMEFFSGRGRVPLKTERGGRVFPVSDHSSDVIRALERELKRLGVTVQLQNTVKGIEREREEGFRLSFAKGAPFHADAVILATGGKSYPTTGSDGTAFALAEGLGHKVTPLYPALVPLITREQFPRRLAGLTLKNVNLSILDGEKTLYSEFGGVQFTHTGIGGLLARKASALLGQPLAEGRELMALIDMKPALTMEQLSDRILRECDETPNQVLKNLMPRLMPKNFGEIFLETAALQGQTRLHSLTKEMRQTLIHTLKAFPLTITDTAGYREAIITNGGIPVKEIDPATMESKIVKGLYFAGEMIDCDAHTGGFNLQIAWSTGRLAGESTGEKG